MSTLRLKLIISYPNVMLKQGMINRANTVPLFKTNLHNFLIKMNKALLKKLRSANNHKWRNILRPLSPIAHNRKTNICHFRKLSQLSMSRIYSRSIKKLKLGMFRNLS